MKVKSLEDELRFQKSKSKRRRLTLVTSEDEEDLVAEDPSKHGRSLIGEMDLDARISLVPPHVEVQGRNVDTTADDLTLAETLMEIRKSAAKDKGKAKIDETESPRKMKQRERAQISRDEEVAQNLQEDFDVAERQRMAQVHQAAQGFTDVEWDDVLARVVADEDFLEVQRLKRAGQEVLEEPVKRRKIGEASGSGEEQSAKKEKDLSEEELQKLLVIIPVEEVFVEALQVKYPIIDYEVYIEDTRRYMHDPLVWRLYDTCGVHHGSSVRGPDIFMLVEKEYPLTRGTLGLMMVARLLVEAASEMSRELLRKNFYQANKPRQGGLLGIRGFYNLMLLVQVCAAVED
ncbi:hypothetical protein Tco_0873994 [Tanacetum coccineum]|uniref:Uncharacterized protein n=1 Tax=Tanacetum coccineum TaxID=301880 RepID=A0ABQ5BP18_9ASTR